MPEVPTKPTAARPRERAATELLSVIDALESGWAALIEAVLSLDDAARARDSVLPGWTVAQLAAHLAVTAGSMTGLAAAPPGTPPMTLGGYLSRYSAAAPQIGERARADAAELGSEQVTVLLRDRSAAQIAFLRGEAGGPGAARRVLSAPRGPLRLREVVLSRLIEVVVHSDDLGRSLGPTPQWPQLGLVDRVGLRIVCRALADVVAEQAPGHTVELRVPPYAAVQLLAGPRHTRGTPPNVVQSDPLTWLRLATGRFRWDELVEGLMLSASGERADLSALLPLL